MPSKDPLDYTSAGGQPVKRMGELGSAAGGTVWVSEMGRESRYYLILSTGEIFDRCSSEEATGQDTSDYTFGETCMAAL